MRLLFGECALDPARRELSRGGEPVLGQGDRSSERARRDERPDGGRNKADGGESGADIHPQPQCENGLKNGSACHTKIVERPEDRDSGVHQDDRECVEEADVRQCGGEAPASVSTCESVGHDGSDPV